MLEKYSDYSSDLCHFIMMAIEFLLAYNFFSFNREFYLQKVGAPMRFKFSPSLTNLVMSFWEELYIFMPDDPFFDAVVGYGR